MELSAHILALVCLGWFLIPSVRYFTHMFQLNSYTETVQIGWMKQNFPRFWQARARLYSPSSRASTRC